MIEIKLSFTSIDDAIAFLSRDKAQPSTEAVDARGTEQPARKRRTKAEMEAARLAETGAAPVVRLDVPVKSPPEALVMQTNSDSLFGATTAAPVEAIKPPSQKELVNAARNLANAKGTDPVVALLKQYGDAKSVVLIPQGKWHEAIGLMAKAAGVTRDAIIATPAGGK